MQDELYVYKKTKFLKITQYSQENTLNLKTPFFAEHLWMTGLYFAIIYSYNQLHNILRLFDVLPNFPFTTSETMHDYYLKTWYIRVASRVAQRLKS